MLQKCGRPGDDGVSNGVTCYPSSDDHGISCSKKLDNYNYSKNPNHCNDMNSSDPQVHSYLRLMETLINRNCAIGKKLKEEHEKMREGRAINGLMSLSTGRITARVLAGIGQHKF